MSQTQEVNSIALKRLQADYMQLKKEPVPFITAEYLPSNILEWHYRIEGPKDSPYEGGIYHGKLIFPPQFPFKPPGILMFTPNGRFKPDTKICLSLSDYHPEQWNPAWTVGAILTALLSFMLENSKTTGSIKTTDEVKRELAIQSIEFNRQDPIFTELFPDDVKTDTK